MPNLSREAVILLVAPFVLILSHYHGHVRWAGPRAGIFAFFAIQVSLLLVVPVVVIKGVLREPLRNFGLGWGKVEIWRRDWALASALLLPAALLVAYYPALHVGMPQYRAVLDQPGLLLPSTLGWGVCFFAWEFFFRGFLLFGLAPRFGKAAVFVQLLPFVMAHFSKSEFETWASLVAGIGFGVIAWRGKSFLPTWLIHWPLATLINVLIVVFSRS